MHADQEIRRAQKDWAKSKGIPFDSRGYVQDGETNLWKPLSAHARRGFAEGAGSELSGHMKALHSSSALVANFFDYWADVDKTPLLSALDIDLCGGSLDFEAQFHTRLGGTPPHLDVSITQSVSFVVAIESKFTEHLKRSTRGKSKFTTSYFPTSCELWAESGLPSCQAFAQELRDEELHGSRQQYEYLDPRQLLKHALGLATQLGNRFSLYYLYYDWSGKKPEVHRREVDLFADRVGTEIRFKAFTYQQVYERLQDSGQADSEYLEYLATRYFA